jgi:integrase
MKIRVPHLVAKPARHGRTRYYWQPSATLKAAGWEPQTLGHDLDQAMKLAAEWNGRVNDWRDGATDQEGARAAKARIKRFARPLTMRALIADFRADRWPHLGAATQRTYSSALEAIDKWGGDQQPSSISAESCRKLLAALARPAAPGGEERLHRASGIGRVLRTLMQWAVDNDHVAANPMDRVRIRQAPPRHQIWPDHCIEAMVAMADAMELGAIGTATLLAADTGQREGDILKLGRGRILTEGGRRSIRLQQGKTKVWVQVPLTARLSARLDQLDAENKRREVPVTTIIVRASGQPYASNWFIRQFAAVRAATIAGDMEKGLQPCPELEGLQYRDLRRTLIVRLAEAEVDLPGIAAISGHQIEACKKILETYMPRTGKMAAAAVQKLEAHRAERGAEGQGEAAKGLTAEGHVA